MTKEKERCGMPTVRELRGEAKKLGLTGFSKWKKTQLTQVVEEARDLSSIRRTAQKLKLKVSGEMSRTELIWAIQKTEGNTPCFARIPDCGVTDCRWRGSCLPAEVFQP